ncbi:MAG: VanZ family protein [Clostridiales bacterium]|nr:VanZ family protein [Clostridiales bacterium]
MKLTYISWIPMVILMIIIFCFSHQQAEGSNEKSLPIANGILSIHENITNTSYDGEERVEKLNIINHVVRKLAHFTEYAILAISVAFFLWTWNFKDLRLILLSIIITSIYAVTDEVHQLFIPGRSGEIKDVLIDSLGGIAGALLFYLFTRFFAAIHPKDKNVSTSK